MLSQVRAALIVSTPFAEKHLSSHVRNPNASWRLSYRTAGSETSRFFLLKKEQRELRRGPPQLPASAGAGSPSHSPFFFVLDSSPPAAAASGPLASADILQGQSGRRQQRQRDASTGSLRLAPPQPRPAFERWRASSAGRASDETARPLSGRKNRISLRAGGSPRDCCSAGVKQKMGDPGSSYSTTDPKPSPDPRREEAALCSFMSAEVGIVRAAPVLLKMAGERR